MIKHSSSCRSTCLRLIFLEELSNARALKLFASVSPEDQIRAVSVQLLMECIRGEDGQYLHVEDGDYTFCCQMVWVQIRWVRQVKPREMFWNLYSVLRTPLHAVNTWVENLQPKAPVELHICLKNLKRHVEHKCSYSRRPPLSISPWNHLERFRRCSRPAKRPPTRPVERVNCFLVSMRLIASTTRDLLRKVRPKRL
jgi:hypothetical protein